MPEIGLSLTFTKMWHRLVASYVRALAATLGTVGVGNVVGNWGIAFWSGLFWALIGACIPPTIVFLTEAADLIDDGD